MLGSPCDFLYLSLTQLAFLPQLAFGSNFRQSDVRLKFAALFFPFFGCIVLILKVNFAHSNASKIKTPRKAPAPHPVVFFLCLALPDLRG